MYTTLEYLFVKKVQIIILAIAFASFVLIALDLLFDGALIQFDGVLNKWSPSWHTPTLDSILSNITKMGNLFGILVISLFVSLVLLWQKDRWGLLFYAVALLGSTALFNGLKELFARARPSDMIGELIQHGYSFPSGHATMSMTVALVLFYLFYHKVSGVYRVLLIAFTLLFPLVISFSRIYLGVHYFSDVSAGLMLGIFWVLLMVLLFRKKIIK